MDPITRMQEKLSESFSDKYAIMWYSDQVNGVYSSYAL